MNLKRLNKTPSPSPHFGRVISSTSREPNLIESCFNSEVRCLIVRQIQYLLEVFFFLSFVNFVNTELRQNMLLLILYSPSVYVKHFIKLFDLLLKHEKKDGTGSLEKTRQMFFLYSPATGFAHDECRVPSSCYVT